MLLLVLFDAIFASAAPVLMLVLLVQLFDGLYVLISVRGRVSPSCVYGVIAVVKMLGMNTQAIGFVFGESHLVSSYQSCSTIDIRFHSVVEYPNDPYASGQSGGFYRATINNSLIADLS